MKTVLTVKDLCDRWGVDARTVSRYEDEGIIKRLPKLPGVKFSLISIEKLEFDGTDNLLLRKEKENQELRLENLRLRNMFEEIKEVLR